MHARQPMELYSRRGKYKYNQRTCSTRSLFQVNNFICVVNLKRGKATRPSVYKRVVSWVKTLKHMWSVCVSFSFVKVSSQTIITLFLSSLFDFITTFELRNLRFEVPCSFFLCWVHEYIYIYILVRKMWSGHNYPHSSTVTITLFQIV